MKKQCQFILLPTDKATSICYLTEKGKEFNDLRFTEKESLASITGGQNYYLYILSDDIIKEDDWLINTNLDINKAEPFKKNFKYDSNDVWYKKIIATTNPEFWVSSSNIVYAISQSDIEYIISLYNGKGKEVDVYESAKIHERGNADNWDGYVKGYNQCLQDKANKKFTLEDMYMLSAFVTDFIAGRKGDFVTTTPKNVADKFIQSLTKEQKSNTIIVEYDNMNGLLLKPDYRPKLKDGCIVVVKN